MAYENDEEGLIRRYLLGRLEEDELLLVEEKIMSDTEFFNRVILAEDEMVEQYVQGDLLQSDRAEFEASFLSTPEGRHQVSLAKALSKYVSLASAIEEPPTNGPASEGAEPAAEEPAVVDEVPRRDWWSRPAVIPYFRVAAAVVLVLGGGLAIWRVFFYQSEVAKGMAALARAYRAERPLEARISGLNYAPYPDTRGIEQTRVDETSLDRAERILLDAVFENPSAASRHALGKLYLAERQFDKAIARFEEATIAQPNNALVHSDYGAALLEKGKAGRTSDEPGKSLEEFARALEHLSKALELDGSLLEALFNRALCRQYLMLPQRAEEDWRTYLEKDPSSRWADEARQHLKELEEQNLRQGSRPEQSLRAFIDAYQEEDNGLAWRLFRQCQVRIGNSIAERLVDQYLDSRARDRFDDANTALAALEYAGELAYEKAGERYVVDLARSYKSRSGDERKDLARARDLVALGQTQIAASDMAAAARSYAKAKFVFDRLGNRCESRSASYWIELCHSQQQTAEQRFLKFERLARACERDGYKWLVVRCLNGIANQHLRLNEYSKAIAVGSQSLYLAQQTEDTYGLVLAYAYLVEAYRSVGNYDSCLHHLQRLLLLASKHPIEPIQACLQYLFAAWVLSSKDLHHSALNYQQLALELALSQNELTMTCLSYAHLGVIQGKLQDYNEAFRNLLHARNLALDRSEGPTGLLMVAYSSLRIGELYREKGDLKEAIDSYGESISLYDQLGYPAFVHQAHKGLFLAYADSGDTVRAQEQLKSAIGYYESHRSKILDQTNRNTFFDQEQNIYDAAIKFENSRESGSRRAFEYSEMSRGRSLLDLVRQDGRITDVNHTLDLSFSDTTKPLSLEDVQRELPDHVQVLQYAVLEDELISWFVTRSEFKTFEKKIDSNELDERIRGYLLLTTAPQADNDERLSRAAELLYDALIRPARPFLDKTKQLFIVPDKILNRVSFQALISPDSGKYLIEEYTIAFSPSSSLLIACSQAARAKSVADERLLAVAVVNFDKGEDPQLSDLPSAEEEVRNIASLYRLPRLIIGEDATRPKVLSEMARANVIHIASHFLVESSPMRSRLLLARGAMPNSEDRSVDRDLEAAEIHRMNLSKARLVVLSACQTGVERHYRGEGAISIARTFVASGVPLVVASFWPVDSNATAELMVNFHRHRRAETRSSAESLRLAQLALIGGGPYRHPYYWASFSLIGGYATY